MTDRARFEVIGTMAQSLGVKVDRIDCSDVADEIAVILRMPRVHVRCTLDSGLFMAEPRFALSVLDRELHSGQRYLFSMAYQHMSKHDRDPHDRLKQIEAAARKLLATLGPTAGGADRYEFEQLLTMKPGAVNWAKSYDEMESA